MTKQKFYTTLIIVLLLCNLALLLFLVFRKSPHAFNPDKPKQIVIERLHFDDAQVKQYEVLIQQHRTDIREKDRVLMRLKQRLYALLKTEDRSAANNIILQMTEVQKQIEEIHFNHFLEIKKICKPEQLNYFIDLSDEINKTFFPKPHLKP